MWTSVRAWLQMVLPAGDQTDLISVNFANVVFQCERAQHTLQLLFFAAAVIMLLVGWFVCWLLH